jgi:hypothetical protein
LHRRIIMLVGCGHHWQRFVPFAHG